MGARDKRVIGFEGMVSTLTVLKLYSADLAGLERALRAKVAELPEFFQDGPLVLDLAAIDGSLDDPDAPPPAALSLAELLALLRRLSLVPVAIRNPRSARRAEAEALGLGALRAPGRTRRVERAAAGSESEPAQRRARERGRDEATDHGDPGAAAGVTARTLTLHQPVRGGQVVYAEDRDAIALAAVNSGGELIADGNVHVYGPLRGRAMAGAHGDASARIFCQSLEAELVSIAGTYLGADDLPESHRGRPAQIRLHGDSLVVEDL